MSEIKISGNMDKKQIDAFLSQPVLARIATAAAHTPQPHVVPIWFYWDGEIIWFSTPRRSVKVRDLKENPYCAVSIDITEGGLRYKAVILEGDVEIIWDPADTIVQTTAKIYTKYLGEEGFQSPTPQQWANDPGNVILKVMVKKIMTWDYSNTALAPIP